MAIRTKKGGGVASKHFARARLPGKIGARMESLSRQAPCLQSSVRNCSAYSLGLPHQVWGPRSGCTHARGLANLTGSCFNQDLGSDQCSLKQSFLLKNLYSIGPRLVFQDTDEVFTRQNNLNAARNGRFLFLAPQPGQLLAQAEYAGLLKLRHIQLIVLLISNWLVSVGQ
eukprot:1160360-Pelagomonas_calceolata.AAC.16